MGPRRAPSDAARAMAPRDRAVPGQSEAMIVQHLHRHRTEHLLLMAALLLLLGVAGVSCGPKGPGELHPRTLQGLLIQCEPADAAVYVDDRYIGSVKGLDRKALPLEPGTHRLELRRDGYFSHFSEVKVVAGVRQRIQVTLRKEPF